MLQTLSTSRVFLALKSFFLDLSPFSLSEWAVNIQRDSYASYVGHYPLLSYFAVAENESIGRERYNFMQVSHQYRYRVLLIV
ncbi:uncharacterized protein M6B38_260015 [Iris pallida]|uniref:Maturase K n=1 Tax=Iris pallida TaxID=29817 RepID=A0AAX6IEY8_IRIPA|nr:uncharacterized protein M6B38_260015 [Iris pallida]